MGLQPVVEFTVASSRLPLQVRHGTVAREVIIIDSTVNDVSTLLAGLKGGVDVYLIPPHQGLGHIAQLLSQYANLDALHVVTHGSPGRVALGSTALTLDTLASYANELALCGAALSAHGSLLFYGCSVAANAEGRSLLRHIACYTGASVAGSKTLTGAGGDWALAVHIGAVAAQPPFSADAMAHYPHHLATDTMDNVSRNGGVINSTLDGIGYTMENTLEAWQGSAGTGSYKGDSVHLSGRIVIGGYYADTYTFTFDSPMAVLSSLAIWEVDGIEGAIYVFTDTTPGSSNAVVEVTETELESPSSEDDSATVLLNWSNVSSFTITQSGVENEGAWLSFDNLVGSALPFNPPPVFVNSGPFSVSESAADGVQVGDVNANDGDGGVADANVTYHIVGGNPNSDSDGDLAFSIHADTGIITVNDADDIDYETATRHTLTIRATDSQGAFTDQQVNIDVVDVPDTNTPPVFTSPTTYRVDENSSAVGMLTATDEDGGSVTFSLTGGADAALFSIDSNNGALSFMTPPDADAPGDADGNNVYDVEVTASDVEGGTDVQTLSITVNDVNEAPTLTSASKASVAENSTGTVYTATGSDPENTPLTYALGGADAALFQLDANSGALSFISAPNFEAPGDADGNNAYELTLTASDGTFTTSAQPLTVSVTNANDAPVFTSPATYRVDENSSAVGTLTATDEDGGSVTFSLTGGADAALFSIDSNNGALSFMTPPDAEAPGDADGNNIYDVEVTASDVEGGTDVQTLSITVNDVNEAPTLTSASKASVAENSTGKVYTATGSDPENTPLTYALGGADAALFQLDANSGALSFITAPNFEAPDDADGNNVYELTLTASDGTFTTSAQPLMLSVTSANDAPVFTSSTTFNVDENSTAVGTLTATDEDGDAVTFSLTGGADATRFSIDSNNGALSFINAPDAEAPGDADGDNVYNVEVTASDVEGGTDVQTLSITVNDVNEAPTLTSASKASVAENSTGTVYIATGSDPENTPLTYALGGADAALFQLDANSGALSFITAPNFEAPSDADGNNVYDLTLTASDGTFTTSAQPLTVSVSNANDAPVLTSPTTYRVDENSSAVGMLTATDEDGGSVTFSLTGGADAALFSIDSNNGALSFMTPPDAEAPGDADGNNVYDVEVTASDVEGGTDVQTLSITVNDVNEAPTLTSASKASVAENITGTVYTATGSDPENTPLTYALGGADAALFQLDANSGALSFITAPNFEAPDDADGNNVYELTLTTSDGTFTTSAQPLTISVTNANDAPSVAVNSGAEVTAGRRVTLSSDMLLASDEDDSADGLHYTLSALPERGELTLNAVALALGDGFTQQQLNDGQVVFTAGGRAETVTVGFTLADGGEDAASSEAGVFTITVGTRPSRPTPVDPIQVTPTPGAPPASMPSGLPSMSETISNNGPNAGTVRLVENTGNTNVVTATLPGGTSLVHQGARSALDSTGALADLIASIDSRTPSNVQDQTGVAAQWLLGRQEGTLLDIRTLTFSSTGTSTPGPILLNGTDSSSAVPPQEAFVIDITALPSGSQIELQHIDFASVIGAATVTGGAGNNVVVGDDAAQYIVLGEGDDTLYGGGGDDVVGSRGGNDRLFGNHGNDELFGGAGADLLHGGSDQDVATFEGNREAYTITQRFGVITVQANSDESDIDTLINIETLAFADGDIAIRYDDDLQWLTGLYAQVLGRQGDVSGVQYWAQQHADGMSRADIALAMLLSEESGSVLPLGEAWVDMLYAGLLGREADASGKAYWVAELDQGASHRDVLDGFLFSPEMRQHDMTSVEWDFFV